MLMAGSIAATALLGLTGSHGIAGTDPKAAEVPPGHRHNHEGLTWPPQPRGITNVVVHSNVEQEIKARLLERDRMDRLERKAKANPEAKQALGDRFTRITVIDKEDKKGGEAVSHMVFFSRDKNATVDVTFSKEEKVQAVNSIPAPKYQPEITDEEIAEAAALARAYFLTQGHAQVAGLKAYGILAYKPEGVGFFDTRVLYVSFHKHDDALPEFAAWVDLTNQLILKARQER
jgi:hypothetical protein